MLKLIQMVLDWQLESDGEKDRLLSLQEIAELLDLINFYEIIVESGIRVIVNLPIFFFLLCKRKRYELFLLVPPLLYFAENLIDLVIASLRHNEILEDSNLTDDYLLGQILVISNCFTVIAHYITAE